MDITLNLAREVLSPYGARLISRHKEPDVSFSMLSFATAGLEPQSGILYVLTEFDTADFAGRLDQRHYALTLADREGAFKALECNLILLDADADLMKACNELNAYIRALSGWALSLERLLAEDESLQAILDASEHMFRNPILVTSKSFQVLAYTKNIPITQPDLKKTVEQGYYTREIMNHLIQNRRLEKIENTRQIAVFAAADSYVKSPTITRAFGPNSLRVNTVALYSLHSEPTEGEMDLTRFLCDVIERRIQTRKAVSEELKSEHLILDLLERKISDREIEAKAILARLPFQADWRIYFIQAEQSGETHINYIFRLLNMSRSFAASLQRDGAIIILDNEKQRDKEGQADFTDWLYAFLTENQAHCGISLRFGTLGGVANAFRQAGSALDLGLGLHRDKRLYSYGDYYVYDLIAGNSNGVDEMCVYREELEAIADRDGKRGTDNLALLHALLINERKITAVSQQMHLHRNSVIYRMKRIEEVLGVCLDDPVERLTLELSIRAFHLIQAGED